MGFKVVHMFPLPGVDLGEKLLEPLGTTFVKGMWRTEEEIIQNAADADAIIGVASFQPYNRRVLGTLSKCRIIASIGIGYEQVDLEAATEHGIVVTNVPDYCLDEVSGLAIGFMLALGHKILQIDRAVREKQVNIILQREEALMEFAYPMFRMRDQTLGIVGLGKIGTATALKARGLGMRVVAYDPYVLGAIMESRGVKPVDLDTLLSFINTARGGCVDQEALIRALQEGLIAGAGIDVTVDEPIAPDNPLLQMDNVILTGHSAWYSTTSEWEVYNKPMTQAVMALEGKWPLYALNVEVQEKWLEKWGKKA